MAESTHSVRIKEIEIEYITAGDAGRVVGYTSDYVARLAREKKVRGRRIGRQWLVDPQSLTLFVADAEKQKLLRGDAVRQERKKEHAQTRTREQHAGKIWKQFGLAKKTIAATASRLAANIYEMNANDSLLHRAYALAAAFGMVFVGGVLGVLLYV